MMQHLKPTDKLLEIYQLNYTIEVVLGAKQHQSFLFSLNSFVRSTSQVFVIIRQRELELAKNASPVDVLPVADSQGSCKGEVTVICNICGHRAWHAKDRDRRIRQHLDAQRILREEEEGEYVLSMWQSEMQEIKKAEEFHIIKSHYLFFLE